jgi:hypothetical protein
MANLFERVVHLLLLPIQGLGPLTRSEAKGIVSISFSDAQCPVFQLDDKSMFATVGVQEASIALHLILQFLHGPGFYRVKFSIFEHKVSMEIFGRVLLGWLNQGAWEWQDMEHAGVRWEIHDKFSRKSERKTSLGWPRREWNGSITVNFKERLWWCWLDSSGWVYVPLASSY